MESKTKVFAEDGRHDVIVTREFDLPVELLYHAYADGEILSEWMGTHVVKFEHKRFGGYQFETKDANGNVVFSAHGVIHDVHENETIIRTFEMGNADFPAQLEFLNFEGLDNDRSKLTMQIIYRSVFDRDEMLKLPFAYGLNRAHNRLQDVLTIKRKK